jgi:hypothetical protein
MRILLSGILLFALCSPAFAQDVVTPVDHLPWLAHAAITVLGAAVAIKLAFEAFARREVSVANVPTFPKYMTSPQQYRLGSFSFAAFAAGFFLLLIYRHKEVAAVSKVFGEGLSKSIIEAVEADAAPYLLVVATPDRIWAEICYMKWWLTQGEGAGEDAIFFTEQSFGFQDLLAQFDDATTRMRTWKAGGTIDPLAASELVNTIKELHNKFARLVACYLIYRNASSEALRSQAKAFGIELRSSASQNPLNPLKYWIVYALALMGSVYVGVYASGIAYDLMAGAGLVVGQDAQRVQSWISYSLSNYGVAIIAVLLLRVVSPYLGLGVHQTHLLTYCWTFVVAFLTGPFGLAIAVHLFGPQKFQTMTLMGVYYDMLKWGFGPALVAVYISYYLDRQTCHDLPDINHSRSTLGWRLLNCFGFAAFTVFLLLPPLLALEAQPGAAWDTAKLRFVASGTTFFIALGLALAAQFALRKGTGEPSPALAPQLN